LVPQDAFGINRESVPNGRPPGYHRRQSPSPVRQTPVDQERPSGDEAEPTKPGRKRFPDNATQGGERGEEVHTWQQSGDGHGGAE